MTRIILEMKNLTTKYEPHKLQNRLTHKMMKSQKLQKYDSLLQTVSQKPVTNIIQPNETQNRKCLKTVIIRDFGGKEKEKNVCVCVCACEHVCVCVCVQNM